MRRRAALLPLLAAAHVAVVIVAVAGGETEARAPDLSVIATYAVPLPAKDPPAPPMTELAVANDVAVPLLEPAAANAGAMSPAGSGGDCSVADTVGAALRDDPQAAAALAAVPAGARTVANALMLWDGQWTALPSSAAGAALTRLRAIIVAGVRSAPLACQLAPVTGPRLVIVPDEAGAVVLAFGSGTWTWAELTG